MGKESSPIGIKNCQNSCLSGRPFKEYKDTPLTIYCLMEIKTNSYVDKHGVRTWCGLQNTGTRMELNLVKAAVWDDKMS